ncbi:Uncharacterised protein [Cedecea neteri]|uniref:Uncharacterized protein n=1 Tax=Cedecea neteri TaxID=158822 RepID=A0A2X3JFZ6_9ENTR|nr:Uncharacterised protein [Cedecea neteri]
MAPALPVCGAALSAARLAAMHDREDIEIAVLAPQPELRVRPRFYETEVASLVAPLQPLFDVTGVTFVKGEAQRIDSVNQCVWYRDEQGNSTPRQYDRLVLATGSNLKRDLIDGAQSMLSTSTSSRARYAWNSIFLL